MRIAPDSVISGVRTVPETRMIFACGSRARMLRQGGGAVQAGHPIIHQDDVRLMACVGLDGLEAGADDLDDFVAALRHERGERRADVLLVVCDQDSHGRGFAEVFMPGPGEPPGGSYGQFLQP
jgi:hypothetical protein